MNIFKLKFISPYLIIDGSLRDICSQFKAGDTIKVQYLGDRHFIEDKNYWHTIKVPVPSILDSGTYRGCIVDSYHPGNIGHSISDTNLSVWRLLEPI